MNGFSVYVVTYNPHEMFEVEDYQSADGKDPYIDWLNGLSDRMAKARVAVRVQRMAAGNFGDCKPVRDGVQELKIDHGPGYRVYLSRQGPVLVLLLCGSDKGDQDRAIKQAIDYLNDWKQRGKP